MEDGKVYDKKLCTLMLEYVRDDMPNNLIVTVKSFTKEKYEGCNWVDIVMESMMGNCSKLIEISVPYPIKKYLYKEKMN